MTESQTNFVDTKTSAPWFVPIFLELEAGVKSLGFLPVQEYSEIPLIERPKEAKNALNQLEGKGTQTLTNRKYIMSYKDQKFITVGIGARFTNSRGFEYNVSVGYGDHEITPVLAALQGVKPSGAIVHIDRWEVMQIASKATNTFLKVRGLRKGEPYENDLKTRLQYLDQYGIPWAKESLRDDSFAESILGKITNPAMTIAYAIMLGRFDFAQSKLDVVEKNRNQRIESWSQSPTCSSRQEAEKAVDARHLSESTLPNPQFIDGEFIRLAQKAIDEKSIGSLMSL